MENGMTGPALNPARISEAKPINRKNKPTCEGFESSNAEQEDQRPAVSPGLDEFGERLLYSINGGPHFEPAKKISARCRVWWNKAWSELL